VPLVLALRPEGSELTGEDERFTYRLERATPGFIAALDQERTERAGRFFAVVKAGAAYDGVFRNRDGFVSRARLRITEINAADGIVFLNFESREQNGIYAKFRGSYDPVDRTLALTNSGGGKFNPSGVRRVPFFSEDAAHAVTLKLGDSGFTGAILNRSDWSMEFTAQPGAVASLPPPEYPAARGAYVLSEGQWLPLPRNGGRVTYGAMEVLTNITGFLGALNGALGSANGNSPSKADETRPDKLGDLTFDGREPVPAVAAEGVVIVLVGEIQKAPADMLQKYPELRDYPAMEMAPSRRSGDGKRQVDLLRIVPGLGGFRDQRIAAIVEEVRPGVTLHTCTARLDSGSYAIGAGGDMFELNVR